MPTLSNLRKSLSGETAVAETKPAAATGTVLTLADLWAPCGECNGSGKPKPPARSPKGESWRAAGVMANQTCCTKCRGKGGAPTQIGEAVMQFMELVSKPAYRQSYQGPAA
jgi:hypothetical protein